MVGTTISDIVSDISTLQSTIVAVLRVHILKMRIRIPGVKTEFWVKKNENENPDQIYESF